MTCTYLPFAFRTKILLDFLYYENITRFAMFSDAVFVTENVTIMHSCADLVTENMEEKVSSKFRREMSLSQMVSSRAPRG